MWKHARTIAQRFALQSDVTNEEWRVIEPYLRRKGIGRARLAVA